MVVIMNTGLCKMVGRKVQRGANDTQSFVMICSLEVELLAKKHVLCCIVASAPRMLLYWVHGKVWVRNSF